MIWSMKTFISYSHKDEKALERLHTHLAVLRRESRIDAWFDRKILPGGQIDSEILLQLEASSLILLLVSPDFLASDYCIEREMEYAFERHRSGEARIIPIIVEPCDWASTELRNLNALPRDGKAISEWANQEAAYHDVVRGLRRVLDAVREPQAVEIPAGGTVSDTVRSGGSLYRIKRTFDEVDRSEFCEAAFAIIREYFREAIAEIQNITELKGRFVSISRFSFTCTIINRTRTRATAHITVHSRKQFFDIGDIYYSFTENAPNNAANGMFNIEADDYELFLDPIIMSSGQHDDRFSPETAAEYLWRTFLQQAEVSVVQEIDRER